MVEIYEGIKKIVSFKKNIPSVILPIKEALGYISADDIYANISLPIFDNSAMDGYAYAKKASKYKVVDEIFAGDRKDILLKDDECVKIMTGARVPSNAISVIPQENITKDDDFIFVKKDVKDGANIRKIGEDIKKGDLVLKKGEKITSNFISLLSSQGITHLKVYKKPRVALIASGNELKMPYENLEENQIYNSNIPYLMSRLRELGAEVDFLGKTKDDLEQIKALIQSALNYDLIITSGGISVGEADFTKQAFVESGFEIIFQKVNIKPGKPTTFGKIRDTFVLNLPGNPFALAANFEIFGKIIMNLLSQKSAIFHNFILCKMKGDFTKTKPVNTVIPGFFDGEFFNIAPQFSPHMVNVLNHANGLIVVSKDKNSIKENEIVKFIPINWEFVSTEFKEFLI